VRLAAANGFGGIGLWVEHYRKLEAEGFAPGGLRELLDEHGVALAEIDVVPGLRADGVGGEQAAATDARRASRDRGMSSERSEPSRIAERPAGSPASTGCGGAATAAARS
jgi:sugar phosphate isomerase/epimerase